VPDIYLITKLIKKIRFKILKHGFFILLYSELCTLNTANCTLYFLYILFRNCTVLYCTVL